MSRFLTAMWKKLQVGARVLDTEINANLAQPEFRSGE